MKLMLIITEDHTVKPLLEAFTENGWGVTRLASTGGFLKQGNTTLMMGIADEKVADVCAVIREVCKERTQGSTLSSFTFSGGQSVGGAIVFLLDVERFERI